MDDELRRAKLFLAGLVLLVVSCVFGYEELSYLFLGRETSATVTGVKEITTHGRTGEHTHREVEFTFVEPGGTRRTGSDRLDTSWTPPANGVIQVRYTPGADGRARLAGHVNWLGVGMFAVALCLVLFFGVRLWLQARAATRPRKRKSSA
jgi:hypothetical protein